MPQMFSFSVLNMSAYLSASVCLCLSVSVSVSVCRCLSVGAYDRGPKPSSEPESGACELAFTLALLGLEPQTHAAASGNEEPFSGVLRIRIIVCWGRLWEPPYLSWSLIILQPRTYYDFNRGHNRIPV